VDPISLHELALELKMTIGEIKHGRGTPMSAHELTVLWPAFFDYKHREAERQAEYERHQRGRR
jgi:hypothetical protein